MIDRPLPFREAIAYILDKELYPADWDSRDWSNRERELRIRSFFSAKVESARFLDRAHGLLLDYLAGTTEQVVGPDGVERTAIKIGDRATFVRRMREFMIAEGMATQAEFDAVNQDDMQNIRSEERLRLIFDTNVRQAYGFGQYVQGSKPAVLYRFPAARLIRVREVEEPRPRHAAHEGEVRVKTDPWWSDYINDEDIGGFGVPWEPYGFNSGMGQEDVTREEAQALGLNLDGIAAPKKIKFTDGVKASTSGLDPALRQKLKEELKARRKPADPVAAAREAAARARERALERRGETAPQFRHIGEAIVID